LNNTTTLIILVILLMYSYLYNWFYFTEDEIIKAQEQIDFYETIILNIVNKDIITEQTTEKIYKIQMTIDSIKYKYSL
jgi:predicted negative regulator of RcsB-dependent stress response